ncbi:hypothetical protein [Nonomuraea typhae]|uniref:hypothetical protein n=1 Tax=Nonomuraea typhae TaxID=2603600 RepID=UPI0012FBCA59|nr:hypothetical protein [Nonomuraea typhae]
MTTRTVLVPDLDDEITHAMNELEELLLTFAVWEEHGEIEPGELPAPLSGRQALAVLHRLWDAVAPTQGQKAVQAGLTGRQLASDGRYEYLPVRLVDVDPADVVALAELARLLGDPHAPDVVRDGLENGRAQMPAGELVMRTAQLAGLLDLADSPEGELLRERLALAGPADDVVFTVEEEAAYKTLVTRTNAMWALGSPVERFRYDGGR